MALTLEYVLYYEYLSISAGIYKKKFGWSWCRALLLPMSRQPASQPASPPPLVLVSLYLSLNAVLHWKYVHSTPVPGALPACSSTSRTSPNKSTRKTTCFCFCPHHRRVLLLRHCRPSPCHCWCCRRRRRCWHHWSRLRRLLPQHRAGVDLLLLLALVLVILRQERSALRVAWAKQHR